MRICGTTASLAGLEQALHNGDATAIELAIRRILAMMGVIFAAGGIPLLYLGDEVGTLNDYGYQRDVTKADDNRWVHRPFASERALMQRHDPITVAGRIFGPVQRMIALRKSNPIFAADQPTCWLYSDNEHVALFARQQDQQAIYVAVNFSPQPQTLDLRRFITGQHTTDLLTETPHERDEPLTLPPYGVVWLHTTGTN
jgi:amylosucrase